MVTDARLAEYTAVVAGVSRWASSRQDIVAIGVVGSWARGTYRPDSDVDIVVLTTAMTAYIDRDDWIEPAFGQRLPVVRRAQWGVLIERRLQLPSGLEVEMGFVPASWAEIDPLDPGTNQVVKDGGLVPVYDPSGVLTQLAAAIE
jgi:predicted nucleotidyltransferase